METVSELRRKGREFLETFAETDVPALEADVLLMKCLGWSKTELLTRSEFSPPFETVERYQKFLERRKAHEPIAYIVGEREFYGIDFEVGPAVLIPRPDTELVVERALSFFQADLKTFTLIDVGVGSGAIVLSILSSLRDRYGGNFLERGKVIAIDASAEALAVARRNGERLGLLKHVTFLQRKVEEGMSDFFGSADSSDSLVMVVSNPPYIPLSDVLSPTVQLYEPELALRAGKDGLNVIRELFSQTFPRLMSQSGGQAVLVMEFGDTQRPQIESLLPQPNGSQPSELGKSNPSVEFFPDLEGRDRVVVVSWKHA